MNGAAPRRRASLKAKLLLAAIALLLALGLAEGMARMLPAPHPLGAIYYRDVQRNEVEPKEALARGIIDILTPPEQSPRVRGRFAPGAHFYICYRDAAALQRSWFDEQGCVEVQISKWGIREREEIGPDKPAGQKRIVCVGDSFTFGWGIPVEQGWVRRLEDELRQGGKDIRTVNCGAAGAIVTDQYAHALRTRFHVFQPDAVIVTLCLNDLIPCNGLCLIKPAPTKTGLALLDRARLAFHDPLALDPAIDWVGILLGLSKAEGEAGGMYNDDVPFDAMWSQGTPQRSLKEMQGFCAARNIPLLVVVWPFLQGLAPGQHYPFAKLHDLVGNFCRDASIPCLDLLPVLRGQRPEALWVTPADMHANPRGQALVTPAITTFVKKHCGL